MSMSACFPAERRFEHRIGQQGAALAGIPGLQVLQVPAQRRGTKSQLREDGAAGANGEIPDEIRDAEGIHATSVIGVPGSRPSCVPAGTRRRCTLHRTTRGRGHGCV